MTKNFFDKKDYNIPVFETNNFMVIPSLGALIEGWLLIVPKNMYLNFSQLPGEMLVEVHDIICHLKTRFLPLFESEQCLLFEHGPANLLSTAGCGVDYAHLHWVPCSFDLLRGVNHFLELNFDWIEINGLNDLHQKVIHHLDYLYLQDQQGRHFLTTQSKIPSQTFRKVIAYYLNQPEHYDWKLNQGEENIRSIYKKLNLIA